MRFCSARHCLAPCAAPPARSGAPRWWCSAPGARNAMRAGPMPAAVPMPVMASNLRRIVAGCGIFEERRGLCDERLAFLKRLRTWPVFGAGLSRRVADVRRAALAAAHGAQDRSVARGRGEVPPETSKAGHRRRGHSSRRQCRGAGLASCRPRLPSISILAAIAIIFGAVWIVRAAVRGSGRTRRLICRPRCRGCARD